MDEHMHAIVCRGHGGREVMQYEEILRAEPVAHAVHIKFEAIGVNYVDTMRRSGSIQPLSRRHSHPALKSEDTLTHTGFGRQLI
jgi:NADPH:quinone reductase-like Zn-dependent oxidoreductase